ncbi:esterase/lipase [Shimia isoporae]|uniref:Esterase/lipase n=1 Tax=Shimia isoporae TaxID=647720 RepID=A0A4R1NKY4_9RHOB|nr:alpha/beta fold hydrolase [Shimia isoporae]TCL08986.1 esterase/lipase [Shimia isoporae]
MRTFGKFLGRLIVLLILVAGAMWIFGPYESISVEPTISEADVDADVEAYFAAQEARFTDITEGVEKRVIWAGEKGARTDLAIVYVHGFSATSEEIRPVPDLVAEELGANLVFTRLAGHGRDGEALAAATAQQWADDFAEAMIVARRIADDVVVIGTSTGGTVIAAMADQPEVMANVKGLVFVSPNFEIYDPAAALLTWPGARHWIPLIVGSERAFEASNDAHAKYWTTAYPTVAVMQMAALVKHTDGQDFEGLTQPAMFVFSDGDRVVQPAKTRAVAERWGGPVTLAPQTLSEGSDPFEHVISGAIISPAEIEGDVSEILNFINSL